jgi:hypothetical protein
MTYCSHPIMTSRVPIHSSIAAALIFATAGSTAADGPSPSFRQDVLPLLTKAGCNSGSCHGKLSGQNGFKLSLRGFAAEWDYDWITKDVNGRRVNYAFPEQSLLIEKACGGVVHEGGTRFRKGSREWQTLVDWVAGRAVGPQAEEPDATKLEISGGTHTLKPGETQQLVVKAIFADGRERDVTWLAQFFSNDEGVVKVKPTGLVKALRHGEGVVRVHFQTLVAVTRFTMPFEHDVAGSDFTTTRNQLDGPIFKKLADLRLPPSPPADDRSFVRRAYLDTIGTLPTMAEVESFVADAAPDKREKLAAELVERPEWLDYWTLQIADILQNRRERDHDVRGVKGVRSFHSWLRGELAAGKSWADISRSVLLAKGDVVTQPAVGYFTTVVGEMDRVEKSELPDSVAQSFLGTRIGCARCHNHPLERYTQDDFYHFAAFFGKVSMKRAGPGSGLTELELMTPDAREARKRVTEAEARLAEVSSPEFATSAKMTSEEIKKQIDERGKNVAEATKQFSEVMAKPPAAFQPRTSLMLEPQTLDRAAWKPEPGRDAREQLVEWMLASEQFSGAMANRVWKHFFGSGLVEPVDDLRSSNPPSNGELWALLNTEFRKANFDLRHIMRLILTSRAYGLSSQTLTANESETRFYSHYYARRLPAEVLSDAIASATGVPTKFDGYPLGLRAIQLPDPQVGSYFLSLFGRSDRVTACACERKGEVTLPQLLHLHNGDEIQLQIAAADGRLSAILKDADDRTATDALFALSMQRKATDAEFAAILPQLAAGTPPERAAAFADVFWALLNTKEFAFNH